MVIKGRSGHTTPMFADITSVLRFVGGKRSKEEAPWEKRFRLALHYSPGRDAIEEGMAFADIDHLGLVYPLSNRTGGRKRRTTKVVKFVPWYERA